MTAPVPQAEESSGMILRCSATGRVFFSAQEAQDHAEAFGRADFEELAPDSKVWVSDQSGKPLFSESEIQNYKAKKMRRLPGEQVQAESVEETFTQISLSELKERFEQKRALMENDARVQRFCDAKKLQALVEVKGHSYMRAEKALWYTNNGSVKEAEAWIREHGSDPDIDTPLKLPADYQLPSVAGESAPLVLETDAEATENPQFVKEAINESFLKELLEMGFSSVVAEKALYKVDNASVEHATNWIADRSDDPSLEHPISANSQQHQTASPDGISNAPKMGAEEAQAAALEIQRKLRAEKEAREKQEAIDREKARIAQTKLMQDTQKQLEEDQRKRDIEALRRDREETARHRAELKEKMRQDYIERFGVPPPEETEEDKVKEMRPKDKVAHHINHLKKTYKVSNPGGLKVCLSTLKIYLGNIIREPENSKFHKIKVTNKAFQERVAPFEGARETLEACGFLPSGDTDFIELREGVADGWLCGQAIKFLDLVLAQLP